jgi:hypothetical protein
MGAILQALAATIILTTGAWAQPRIDVEKLCRASQTEIVKLFGDATRVTFEGCMRQQNEALQQLTQYWRTYPSEDKTRCVQERVYMPSYVEWLSCLESRQVVRRIQAEQRAKESSPKPARGSARTQQ